jgi:hypothetical protein
VPDAVTPLKSTYCKEIDPAETIYEVQLKFELPWEVLNESLLAADAPVSVRRPVTVWSPPKVTVPPVVKLPNVLLALRFMVPAVIEKEVKVLSAFIVTVPEAAVKEAKVLPALTVIVPEEVFVKEVENVLLPSMRVETFVL